jgi:hypothetical protein
MSGGDDRFLRPTHVTRREQHDTRRTHAHTPHAHTPHTRAVVPVLVSPELAGGAHAGLDLIDDEGDVVLLGDVAEALEEVGRRPVVATLGLDGLHDETRHRHLVRLDHTPHLPKN